MVAANMVSDPPATSTPWFTVLSLMTTTVGWTSSAQNCGAVMAIAAEWRGARLSPWISWESEAIHGHLKRNSLGKQLR
jgi:hypothetical protein